MALLEVRNLTKSYGDAVVLQPTDLFIKEGEFITLLGPSGCGKSTLLRMLMGITDISGGEIKLRGERIDRLPPEKRNISMVFQSYALFPHMSVEKNITFGLRMKGISKAEKEQRVKHAVEICNLKKLMSRMPKALSGGQQQRVALARAIVMQSDLLLFDEPLSNLDAKLRESLRDDLLSLHRRVGATSLYVTHDQTEAMTMSDRVVVMDAGHVVETGTPAELYRKPRTLFTAQFLGQTNILEVNADGTSASLPWGQHVILSSSHKGTVNVCCRPEDIMLISALDGFARVENVQFYGAATIYIIDINGLMIKVSIPGQSELFARGSRVHLCFNDQLHVLETGTSDEFTSDSDK